MSAFVVSKFQIDAILTAALNYGADGVDRNSATDIGRVLWLENGKSFAALYPAKVDAIEIATRRAEVYVFKAVAVPSIVEAAKLVDSLEYQSCEHDGWARSDALAWLGVIRAALLRSLPGYEGAAWAVDRAA
ncbi:hypothetical protein [Methylobacterium iners]|uniref:Uncharacterized protein n=1 Tax=Methylobacterium iners TaxID=418707 RepID=A0ABQ4S3H4_9HYPH|nr:hypothetical protein [Methylobacterium iners]GJD97441.1 hypothetical protein OCOJLMKI_4672 [Methylobacterium iners]